MIRQYPAPHDPYDASAEDTPLAKLWYGLLADCLKRGAERIHLFPSDPSDPRSRLELPEEGVVIDDEVPPEEFGTFTICAFGGGGWEETMKPPVKMYPAFLQRLKVMAGFSLARRLPIEQGAFQFALGKSVYEIGVTVRVRPDGAQEAMVDLPSEPVGHPNPA